MASVLRPVNPAESEDWSTAEQLGPQLAARWSLPQRNGFATRVCEEAESERAVQACYYKALPRIIPKLLRLARPGSEVA